MPNTDKITADVIAVITDQLSYLGRKPRVEVTPDSSLEAIGADSLDRVEIAYSLDELYAIDIDEASMAATKTVADVVALVKTNLPTT